MCPKTKRRKEGKVKSKYNLALLFAGLPPILALTGVYFWMALSQGPALKAAPNPAVFQANLSSLQSEVETLASSMNGDLHKIHDEIPSLSAHNTDQDLDNFLNSHPGVAGLLAFNRRKS